MFDELEKIGARMRSAGYMQSRSGVRPIRVDTLLNRGVQSQETELATAQPPETDQPMPAEPAGETAAEEAPVGKLASADATLSEKTMSGVAKARPYVVSGIKAGIPAAIFGKIMAGEGAKGSHAARIAGIAGAGLGVANEAMKQWAEKHKQKALAKKILGAGGK